MPAGYYPLTQPQEVIWNDQVIFKNLPLYNIGGYEILKGPFNKEAFIRALELTVDSNQSLKLLFEKEDGMPFQRLDIEHPYQIFEEDFSAKQDVFEYLLYQIRGWMNEVFELNSSPLYQFRVIKAADNCHVFFAKFHHLISDGWSAHLLYQNIVTCYNGFNNGVPYEAKSYSYLSFLKQEKEEMNFISQKLDKQFWESQQLQAIPSLFEDITINPSKHNLETSRKTVMLKHGYINQLRTFKQTFNIDLLQVLTGLLYIYLHRVCEKKDVVFTMPLLNRPSHVYKNTTGMFMKTVPVVLKGSAEITFKELCYIVKTTLSNVYKHSRFDLMKPEIISASSSLNDVFISYQPHRMDKGYNGLINERYTLASNYGKFMLAFEFNDYGSEKDICLNIDYRINSFDELFIQNITDYLEYAIANMPEFFEMQISGFPLINQKEFQKIIFGYNNTYFPISPTDHILNRIKASAGAFGFQTAIQFNDQYITYQALDEIVHKLASGLLTSYSVQKGDRVIVMIDKGWEVIPLMLAIMHIGCVYVPMEPSYPSERISFILEDCKPKIIVTKESLKEIIPKTYPHSSVTVNELLKEEEIHVPGLPVPTDIAYIIYTSGSTGKPKGVMVSYENLTNFMVAIDRILPNPLPEDKWLNLTSISFDISILELLWPLCHGQQVTMLDQKPLSLIQNKTAGIAPIDFSLFYFSSINNKDDPDKYQLFMDSAKHADETKYRAVWIPERHFHEFGGLFPNPVVLASALAVSTKQISIRAGSVVSPLHHPVRVAEDWSVVDNLSGGRVGISFTSGWNPNDFIFYPGKFNERKQILENSIDQIRNLWAGETIVYPGGNGKEVSVKLYPTPLQKSLPVWVTASGKPETFEVAGKIGANILTHLLDQSFEELELNIKRYRKVFSENHQGYGEVTVMLHTFLSTSEDLAKAIARQPLKDYIKSSVGLLNKIVGDTGLSLQHTTLEKEDVDAILDHAVDRYLNEYALIGNVSSCMDTVNRLKSIGVTEIACLIDFGVDSNRIMNGLHHLDELKEKTGKATHSIAEIIERNQITHLQCTPSLANLLIQNNSFMSAIKGIKKWLIGGETLPEQLARKIKETTSAEILNMYGPTETTIWSTFFVVDKNREITIGKPLVNTRAYILDEYLHPLPQGIVGDLFIAGSGVAHGYFNRPELTTEKFVKDPFKVSSKMYKTGDLAKWSVMGELVYCGRKDTQVKLRGHRIELEEINYYAKTFETVKDAVAIVTKPEAEKEQEIILFIICDTPIDNNKLTAYLMQYLPGYMCPSTIIELKEIPMTPNGKIDRNKLQNYHDTNISASSIPQFYNQKEDIIIQIWRDILKKPGITDKDNFFHHGGDSIKAIQMVSRLSDKGMKMEVRDLFTYPTIQTLLPYIKSVHYTVDQEKVCGFLDLTPIQHWFFSLPLLNRNHFNQSAIFKLNIKYDTSIFIETIHILLEHHDALRMTFSQETNAIQQYNNNSYKGLYNFNEFEVTDVKEITELAKQLQGSMNIQEGPMMQVAVFKGLQNNYVLFIFHHLIIDGVSWRIFLEDFSNTYISRIKDKVSSLPLKTNSFLDWSNLLLKQFNDNTFINELGYWTTQLQFNEPLNTSSATNNVMGSEKSIYELGLSENETEQLIEQATHIHHCNVDVLLLTAFLFAWHDVFGRTGLLFNIEKHGRDHLNSGLTSHRTIGWYTAAFPLFMQIVPGISIARNIQKIKKMIEAVPNGGIGFGVLKYLNKKKQLHECKLPVSFNYLGSFDENLEGTIFSYDQLAIGPNQDQQNPSLFLMDINGMIVNHCLKVTMNYVREAFSSKEITQLFTLIRIYLKKVGIKIQGDELLQFQEDVSLDYKDFINKPIERIPKAVKYPLSMHQAFIFDVEMHTGFRSYYNEPRAIYIKGDLNVDYLRKSFDLIVEKHESLRTYFIKENDIIFQRINNEGELSFNIIDLRPQDNKVEVSHEYAVNEFKESFDLFAGPLLRIKLLILEDDYFLLLFTAHHIISDGWSMGILLGEFINIYNFLQVKQVNHLPGLQFQYKDFSQWVNRLIHDDILTQQRAYWLNKLDGKIERLHLPADFQKTTATTVEGDEICFQLSENEKQQLNQLIWKYNTTLYMNFLALVNFVLSQITGQKDIVVGTPVTGRIHPSLENQIGLFINYVVLHTKVSGINDADIYFRNIKEMVLDAFENQIYPFTKLIGTVDYEYHPLYNPLFDVLVMEKINEGEISGIKGVKIEWYKQQYIISRFDLCFYINRINDGYEITVRYKKNLFLKTTIERIKALLLAALHDFSQHKG